MLMLIEIVLILIITEIEGTPVTRISQDNITEKLCTTPECIKAAASILKSINASADPCEDFYNFACGNFIKSTVIPEHRPEYNQFMKLTDKINNQLRKVLEEPILKGEIKPYRFAKNLYQSCINAEKLEEIRADNMLKLIETVGGWPVLTKEEAENQQMYWNHPNFSWIDLESKLRKFGLKLNSILSLTVKVSHDNSSTRMITIDQPELGILREHLIEGFDHNEVQVYYEFMVALAVSLGADLKTAEKEMKEVVELEVELAKITLPAEQRRFVPALIGPISALESQLPVLPWLDYIRGILEPDVKVTLNETVAVRGIHYTVKLSELLKNIKPRTVANFMIFKAVSSLTRFLTKEIRDIRSKFIKDYFDLDSSQPPWEECMSMMTNNVPLILGALYVRHFFSHVGKEEAQAIVDNIISQFSSSFDDIDWMDEETKLKAKQKANNTLTFIGYPDELLNDTVLDEYFRELDLTEGDYLQNIINLNIFNTRLDIQSLKIPVKRDDWVTRGNTANVNAFYNYGKVVIEFSAGIFQEMFFDLNRPKYLNYGGIGYVIGHEFSHGFDDTGRRINYDGSVANWWNNETEVKFLSKAKCFIDQFGNIEVPETGLKINGINSQGEVIADVAGISNAYRAYKEWEKVHGKEELLPGLDYNQNQLFWINYGIAGCEKYRLKGLKEKVLSSLHPPQRYRINGAVKNTPYFAEVFKCPSGSLMNPSEKCMLW